MKIVSILAANDDPDVVQAHLAFHLHVGVDLVIAAAGDAVAETREVLDSYARSGQVEMVPTDVAAGSGWRTDMARRAVAHHGADWVFSSDADEFWWPRGESLPDVLAVIPDRYDVVQALVREFRPRAGDGDFAERLTVRPSLEVSRTRDPDPLEWALRPVYRAHPELTIEPGDGTANGRRVPLRAWYPIEVLRFPFRSEEQVGRRFGGGSTRHVPRSKVEEELLSAGRDGTLTQVYGKLASDDDALRAGLADRSLVEDVRLRDALRSLDAASREGGAEVDALELRAPGIVDDASYAVECAAVGEVDLARLDRHIRELEERIGVLEARFWPRVARTLSRAVRR